jgi:hypothetical protein
MTKKDYEAIATAFRVERPGKNWDANKHVQWDADVNAVSLVMQRDNPRFDRTRFLAACRGEDATDSAGRKVTYAR